MSDYTYPLRVLRHKFAERAVNRDYMGRNLLTSMVIAGTLAIGTSYYMIDETPDNITSSNSVMEAMDTRLANLKLQKQKLLENNQTIADYKLDGKDTTNLELLHSKQSDAFNANTSDLLNIAFSGTQGVSEQKLEAFFNDYSSNIKELNKFDAAFIHECQAESISENPSRSLNNMSRDVKACLIQAKKDKGISVFGMLAMFIPLFINAPSDSKTLHKWAKEKPKKRKNGHNPY